MHVRIDWGRKFQIRGARFEKQTEPDVVRGRNGAKQDWFPLVSWECFVRFSFLQMSCRAVPKWHFCTIRASWRAQRYQLTEGQLRIARWHLQCNEFLSSTDLYLIMHHGLPLSSCSLGALLAAFICTYRLMFHIMHHSLPLSSWSLGASLAFVHKHHYWSTSCIRVYHWLSSCILEASLAYICT